MNGHVGQVIKIAIVSDPPMLSVADLHKLQQDSRRLYDAFMARTRSMEILTSDDLKIRIY